jgi:hypothetical protein
VLPSLCRSRAGNFGNHTRSGAWLIGIAGSAAPRDHRPNRPQKHADEMNFGQQARTMVFLKSKSALTEKTILRDTSAITARTA